MQHFFEDVAVSHGGAGKRDVFLGENSLEAQVGHGSGDDAITLKLVLGFQEAGGSQKYAVAVHHPSRLADEERAVGVSIERHSQPSFFLDNSLLQTFQMKRAAARVDIATVR